MSIQVYCDDSFLSISPQQKTSRTINHLDEDGNLKIGRVKAACLRIAVSVFCCNVTRHCVSTRFLPYLKGYLPDLSIAKSSKRRNMHPNAMNLILCVPYCAVIVVCNLHNR